MDSHVGLIEMSPAQITDANPKGGCVKWTMGLTGASTDFRLLVTHFASRPSWASEIYVDGEEERTHITF